MSSDDSPGLRDELRRVLEEQRGIIDRMLAGVADPSVHAVQLAHWADWLERLDDQRDALIRRLRGEATESRKREEERSVRQFVLRALDEFKRPQNAGFLQDYVWARYGVDLDTKGFGALRRDERRSWSRNPGRRQAYIVPGLDVDGHALARWMARSDWPVEQRIVPAGGERLLDLDKIRALSAARRSGDQEYEPGDPLSLLIEKYGREILSAEAVMGDDPARREARIAEIGRRADAESAPLAGKVGRAQQSAGARLSIRPEEEQLWGVPGRPSNNNSDAGDF